MSTNDQKMELVLKSIRDDQSKDVDAIVWSHKESLVECGFTDDDIVELIDFTKTQRKLSEFFESE